MFGVNTGGEDTLSPQFKKGKGVPGRMEATPMQRDPEKTMAVQSNLDSLKKNQEFLARMREAAISELGANATEGDILALIDKKTMEKAEQLYELGRRETGEAASRSGIIRM